MCHVASQEITCGVFGRRKRLSGLCGVPLCRIARSDANRCPASDAVEEVLPIEYSFHTKVWQEFPVKGTGVLEATNRDHDMTCAMPLIGVVMQLWSYDTRSVRYAWLF